MERERLDMGEGRTAKGGVAESIKTLSTLQCDVLLLQERFRASTLPSFHRGREHHQIHNEPLFNNLHLLQAHFWKPSPHLFVFLLPCFLSPSHVWRSLCPLSFSCGVFSLHHLPPTALPSHPPAPSPLLRQGGLHLSRGHKPGVPGHTQQ